MMVQITMVIVCQVKDVAAGSTTAKITTPKAIVTTESTVALTKFIAKVKFYPELQ